MNKINYQRELDGIIQILKREDAKPSLLLHSCCAPCSGYVIEYLSDYFDITVLYYNPNISPADEYEKRKAEQKRLISSLPVKNKVKLAECDYDSESFTKASKGYEDCREGGARCFRCYELRMRKAATLAKEAGFDYFCTTLSISPLKNAQKINEIGYKLQEELKVKWLPSDFKKREGYKRSIQLSAKYNLYRQNFCGCEFSKKEKNYEQSLG